MGSRGWLLGPVIRLIEPHHSAGFVVFSEVHEVYGIDIAKIFAVIGFVACPRNSDNPRPLGNGLLFDSPPLCCLAGQHIANGKGSDQNPYLVSNGTELQLERCYLSFEPPYLIVQAVRFRLQCLKFIFFHGFSPFGFVAPFCHSTSRSRARTIKLDSDRRSSTASISISCRRVSVARKQIVVLVFPLLFMGYLPRRLIPGRFLFEECKDVPSVSVPP